MSFNLIGKGVRKFRLPVVDYSASPSVVIPAQVGDVNSRAFEITLYDDKGDLDLSQYTNARIAAKTPSGIKLSSNKCEISDDKKNIIVIFGGGFTMEAGRVPCEILLTNTEQNVLLTSQTFYVIVAESQSKSFIAENFEECNELFEALKEIEAYQRAEEERLEGEIKRKNNESTRNLAEDARIKKETERIYNEEIRMTSENNRNIQENERIKSESARISNEETRVGSEKIRCESEDERLSAEILRVTNERNRLEQEAVRLEAETGRILLANELEKRLLPIDNTDANRVGVAQLTIDPVNGNLVASNLKGAPGADATPIIHVCSNDDGKTIELTPDELSKMTYPGAVLAVHKVHAGKVVRDPSYKNKGTNPFRYSKIYNENTNEDMSNIWAMYSEYDDKIDITILSSTEFDRYNEIFKYPNPNILTQHFNFSMLSSSYNSLKITLVIASQSNTIEKNAVSLDIDMVYDNNGFYGNKDGVQVEFRSGGIVGNSIYGIRYFLPLDRYADWEEVYISDAWFGEITEGNTWCKSNIQSISPILHKAPLTETELLMYTGIPRYDAPKLLHEYTAREGKLQWEKIELSSKDNINDSIIYACSKDKGETIELSPNELAKITKPGSILRICNVGSGQIARDNRSRSIGTNPFKYTEMYKNNPKDLSGIWSAYEEVNNRINFKIFMDSTKYRDLFRVSNGTAYNFNDALKYFSEITVYGILSGDHLRKSFSVSATKKENCFEGTKDGITVKFTENQIEVAGFDSNVNYQWNVFELRSVIAGKEDYRFQGSVSDSELFEMYIYPGCANSYKTGVQKKWSLNSNFLWEKLRYEYDKNKSGEYRNQLVSYPDHYSNSGQTFYNIYTWGTDNAWHELKTVRDINAVETQPSAMQGNISIVSGCGDLDNTSPGSPRFSTQIIYDEELNIKCNYEDLLPHSDPPYIAEMIKNNEEITEEQYLQIMQDLKYIVEYNYLGEPILTLPSKYFLERPSELIFCAIWHDEINNQDINVKWRLKYSGTNTDSIHGLVTAIYNEAMNPSGDNQAVLIDHHYLDLVWLTKPYSDHDIFLSSNSIYFKIKNPDAQPNIELSTLKSIKVGYCLEDGIALNNGAGTMACSTRDEVISIANVLSKVIGKFISKDTNANEPVQTMSLDGGKIKEMKTLKEWMKERRKSHE